MKNSDRPSGGVINVGRDDLIEIRLALQLGQQRVTGHVANRGDTAVKSPAIRLGDRRVGKCRQMNMRIDQA
jgi:hypothetical protein